MIETEDIKLVSDYVHMSFNDVLMFDCYTFKKIMIDAFVYKLRSSEEGREYLEDCWLLTQTETDVDTMKKLFKRGGN